MPVRWSWKVVGVLLKYVREGSCIRLINDILDHINDHNSKKTIVVGEINRTNGRLLTATYISGLLSDKSSITIKRSPVLGWYASYGDFVPSLIGFPTLTPLRRRNVKHYQSAGGLRPETNRAIHRYCTLGTF